MPDTLREFIDSFNFTNELARPSRFDVLINTKEARAVSTTGDNESLVDFIATVNVIESAPAINVFSFNSSGAATFSSSVSVGTQLNMNAGWNIYWGYGSNTSSSDIVILLIFCSCLILGNRRLTAKTT